MSFWPHHMAYGILVSPEGIEPVPLAFEGMSLNHWTTKEVPDLGFQTVRFDRKLRSWVYLAWFSL